MAKDLEMGYLLDFYGEVLTQKQREMLRQYYNDDLSLSEIGENFGITRQGARDAIKHGETTLKELEEIKFSFLHIFPYSRKSGTRADGMDNHLDESIKKERLKEIQKIEKEYTLNYYRSFISKKVEVLIEKNEDSKSFGYSKEYIYIEVEGNYPCGEIINVQIESVINDRVVGVCC